MSSPLISLASTTDVESMVTLINSAYRGEVSRQGWTTEADLLAGRRTDAEELKRLLHDPNSMLLVCKLDTQLLGCVHLCQSGDHVQIGMLSVMPTHQGQGLGKQLLVKAEQMAQQTWHVHRMVLSVIVARQELIAFYERRGYRRNGIIKPFPVNPDLWTPKVDGLSLALLEKNLA